MICRQALGGQGEGGAGRDGEAGSWHADSDFPGRGGLALERARKRCEDYSWWVVKCLDSLQGSPLLLCQTLPHLFLSLDITNLSLLYLSLFLSLTLPVPFFLSLTLSFSLPFPDLIFLSSFPWPYLSLFLSLTLPAPLFCKHHIVGRAAPLLSNEAFFCSVPRLRHCGQEGSGAFRAPRQDYTSRWPAPQREPV